MLSMIEENKELAVIPAKRQRRQQRQTNSHSMISVAYYHFVQSKVNKNTHQSTKHRLERLDMILDKKDGKQRWCDGLKVVKEHYKVHRHVYVNLFRNHWLALDHTGFLGGFKTRKQAWASLEKMLQPCHHHPIYLVHTKASVVSDSDCGSSNSSSSSDRPIEREEVDCLFLELTSLKRGYAEIDWSKKKRVYSFNKSID